MVLSIKIKLKEPIGAVRTNPGLGAGSWMDSWFHPLTRVRQEVQSSTKSDVCWFEFQLVSASVIENPQTRRCSAIIQRFRCPFA